MSTNEPTVTAEEAAAAAARLAAHYRKPSFAPDVAFDVEEANQCGEEWRFNCGPGALCAVTGMKPHALRPHMLDFEQKGYTNPTLMLSVLKGLGIKNRDLMKLHPRGPQWWPSFGLVRIQWGGPWTREGVPMAARYRHTHWIAAACESGQSTTIEPDRVFDINAISVGGWMAFAEWRDALVPWLLKECEPKADGMWWVTHSLEIARPK